jgi:pseudaminic acid synthase
MNIEGKSLANSTRPYVIAEMSGNHGNKYGNAERLLIECAQNSATAFKLQTYTPASMTIECARPEYVVGKGPWEGRSLFDLYSQGQTPAAWIPDLFNVAKEVGISIFSTPFSPADVDILEKNNVSAYKIASFEITYTQLLRYIGQTGKPVIFSTGLATLDEIKSAVEILHDSGCLELAILKCSTSYPAKYRSLNLNTIPFLKKEYGVPVGFSDHTIGNTAAVVAVTLGATILEKHVKLDDDISSVDSSFSLPVSDLKSYISDAEEACLARGEIQDGPTEDEKPNLRYRRSIVVKKDIQEGEIFTAENLAIVRPDIGLIPSKLESVLGKTASRNLEFGEGVKLSDINES